MADHDLISELQAKRLKLVATLNSLPLNQFEVFIIALNPPKGIVPPSHAAQGERTFALLNWVEGSSGPGLSTLERELEKIKSNPPVSKAVRLRYERNLIKRIKAEVNSRLQQSLHSAIYINLLKQKEPDRVVRPWDVSVKVGNILKELLPEEASILEVFEQPEIEGRLLILGEPGSGKTTTLIELAQALLDRSEQSEENPIPILFNISNWKNKNQSIRDWLVSELKINYGISKRLALILLTEDRIIPLLDGLDELDVNLQKACVHAINKATVGENQLPGLVISTRTEEYENLGEKLHLNGAILLKSLSDEQVKNYLNDAHQESLWRGAREDENLFSLIHVPLFLSMFLIAFKGENIEEIKKLSASNSKIEYLFNSFIGKMLQRASLVKYFSRQNLYADEEIRLWLSWLAQRLEVNSQAEFLIEKMQPELLPNEKLLKNYRFISRLIFCILTALIIAPIINYIYSQLGNALLDSELSSIFSIDLSKIIGWLKILSGCAIALSLVYFPSIIETDSIETIDTVYLKLPWLEILPATIVRYRLALIRMISFTLLFSGGLVAWNLADPKIIMYIKLMVPGSSMSIGNIFKIIFFIFLLSKIVELINSLSFSIAKREKLLSDDFYDEEERDILLPKKQVWKTLLISTLFILVSYGLMVSAFIYYGIPLKLFALLLLACGIALSQLFLCFFIELLNFIEKGIYIEEIEKKSIPNQGIWRTLRASFLFIVPSSLVFAVIGYLYGGPMNGLQVGLFPIALNLLGRKYSLSTLGGMPIPGMARDSEKITTISDSFILNCINHLSLRITLFANGYIPWNYAHFLGFCTKILFVQQVGGRYRFMHRLLQEHFADMLWSNEVNRQFKSEVHQEGLNAQRSFSCRLKFEYVESIIKRGEENKSIHLYEEALSNFKHVTKLGYESSSVFVSQGQVYWLMGCHEEALINLKCALELDPNNELVLITRGAVYCAKGYYNEALADFNQAIELKPKNSQAFSGRGRVHRLMNSYEEALSDFSYAIELGLNSGWTFVERGETYCVKGCYEEALADFNQAIELRPQNSRTFYSRGRFYRLIGCYEEALSDLNYAIELNPNRSLNFVERGVTYYEEGYYEDALADFNRAIELKPQSSQALSYAYFWCMEAKEERAYPAG